MNQTDFARSLLAKRYPRPVILQLLRDRGLEPKQARDTLSNAIRRKPRKPHYEKPGKL